MSRLPPDVHGCHFSFSCLTPSQGTGGLLPPPGCAFLKWRRIISPFSISTVIEHMWHFIDLALPQASPPRSVGTGAVGPGLLIRQVSLLISQPTSISRGRPTIRHLWTRSVAVSALPRIVIYSHPN